MVQYRPQTLAMGSLTFQQILLQFSKQGIRKTLIRDLVRRLETYKSCVTMNEILNRC